jgi:hypothetical protein
VLLPAGLLVSIISFCYFLLLEWLAILIGVPPDSSKLKVVATRTQQHPKRSSRYIRRDKPPNTFNGLEFKYWMRLSTRRLRGYLSAYWLDISVADGRTTHWSVRSNRLLEQGTMGLCNDPFSRIGCPSRVAARRFCLDSTIVGSNGTRPSEQELCWLVQLEVS